MNDLENDIIKELKIITKLLVLLVTKDQDQKNQIKALDKAGFQPKDIADLIGTTANNVRVTLHGIRKKNK